MRLVAYVRVSGTAQLDGYGPETQLIDIERYVARTGDEIVSTLVEDITGTSEDRPLFTEAVALIESGEADGIVVARLDRLARQLTTQEALLGYVWSHGGQLHTADQGVVQQDDPDDPMRTAMRQMMGVFAELDRKMIISRLHKGRRAARAQGGYIGGNVAFGYRKTETNEIERDPEAYPLVERAVALRSDGATLQTIADFLTAEAGGRVFSPTAVSRILERERAAG